jgi:hypothetical protein
MTVFPGLILSFALKEQECSLALHTRDAFHSRPQTTQRPPKNDMPSGGNIAQETARTTFYETREAPELGSSG